MSIHQVVTSPSSPTSATFRSSHDAVGYHNPTGYRESSDFHDRTGYRESSDYHDRTGYRESTDYQERTAQHDPSGYTEHSSHTEPSERIHPIGHSTGHSTGRVEPAERIEPVVSSTSASSTPPVAMASTQDYADVEKDHGHGGTAVNGNRAGYDLHHDVHDEDTALRRLRTAGSLSISPELFEKIYLSPKNQVSNNVRSTVGNPTPLAIAGFLLSLTPLSNVLMGWRGAGGLGAAETGVYYFFGGMLMIIGAVLEFILGNTFPFVVFGTFGAFWFSYGATLTPYFNAAAAYQPKDPATAGENPQFMATFAFFLVYMGLLCLIYLICALRTNMVFILIFLTLIPAFSLLASVFWHGAQGILVPNQQTAAGALLFITSLLGWYLFFVQLLAAVDFPLNLPVGDMSGYIKGASERKKAA